jgi:hypothetical protein
MPKPKYTSRILTPEETKDFTWAISQNDLNALAAAERRQRYEQLQRSLRRTQFIFDLLGLLLIAIGAILTVKLLLRSFSP